MGFFKRTQLEKEMDKRLLKNLHIDVGIPMLIFLIFCIGVPWGLAQVFH